MADENSNPVTKNVLFDSEHKICQIGQHSGSIITNLNDKYESIIFSDTIEITEDKIIIEGLKVGPRGNLAQTNKGKFTLKPEDTLYSVKMKESIVNTFENERFNASFPYMISLLNSHLLYKKNPTPINHMDFVQGEILNHPIALLYNNSMIIGDRLVVDNLRYPVFYDAFLISRKAYSTSTDELVEFSYDPIRRLDINYIKYIIILGVEMLR